MRARTGTRPPPAMAPAPVAVPSKARRQSVVCAAIAAVTVLAYAPTLWHGFIHFDDPGYVTENRHVLDGLTVDGMGWACTTLTEANWHPLTWLSLQLDASLWGQDPLGFHLTNVLLHAFAAALFFLVLARMTGSVPRSAVVALLFALHPLRVESVAWVSERKDVLSALFWVLTMVAYAWYVAGPSWRRMAVVAGVFAIGLTAKPLLITLPCALVLLDVWPLARIGSRADLFRRIGEKWPLFVLVAGSAFATVYAQSHGGAVRNLTQRSVGERVTGATVGYVVYLRKTVAPVDLAIFYPHPRSGRPWWQLAGAVGVMGAITVGAIRLRRSAPYLLVGWFWYLGTLVPMIGIIQVGDQAYADRYTYIPQIGILLAGVWGAAELLSRVRNGSQWAVGLAVVAVFGATLATRAQLDHWRDGLALWSHALEVTEDNAHARYWRGTMLSLGKRDAEAVVQFERAMELAPEYYPAAFFHAVSLARSGRVDEAEPAAFHALKLAGNREHDLAVSWLLLGDISRARKRGEEAAVRYERALSYNPELPMLRTNYAGVLVGLGRTDEAILVLTVAVERTPNDPGLASYLAELLIERGRWAEATAHLRRAITIDPKNAAHPGRLAVALLALGDREEAIRQARTASQLDSQWVTRTAERAWSLATHPDAAKRDGAAAHRLAELACAGVERPSPTLLDVMAAACAEVGRYDEAVTIAGRGAEGADRIGDHQLASAVRKRAELYRAGQPYRAPRP